MAQFQTGGATTSNSKGTSHTCNENSKPTTWTQLIASTNFAVKHMWLFMTVEGSNSTAEYAVDIGTGGSGSEVVLVPDLYFNGFTSSATYSIPLSFRVDIASGTRVAIRGEGSSGGGSEIIQVVAVVSDTELPTITSPTFNTYGMTLGVDAKAKTFDCGNTLNTKGGWHELAASVSATAQHFYVLIGGARDGTRADANYLVDIGTGAGGLETPLIENMMVKVESAVDTPTPFRIGPFPASDIQSQRVSIQGQADTIDAGDRVLSATLLVVSGTAGGGGGDTPIVGNRIIGARRMPRRRRAA